MIPSDVIELWFSMMSAFAEAKYVLGLPGRRDSATTYTMDVPGRTGYIYVRIWNGRELTLAQALNVGGIPNPNVMVRMERRNGTLVVVSADPQHALNVLGDEVGMANVPKHRHFIGSGNEDPVEGRRFVPGLLAPSSAGGLNVHVFPFFTRYGYVAENASFTIDDPSTASTRAWVLVYADNTNTLQYTVSSTHVAGTIGELDEADIPGEFTLSDGATPVGAVVVANSGSVGENSQFSDYRFHFDHNNLFDDFRALNVNVTEVGNVGTGEDTLISYSVAANTLAANGDRLVFEAGGSFAVATVRLRAYLDDTVLFDTGTIVVAGASEWWLRGTIIREGQSIQKVQVSFISSAAILPVSTNYVGGAEDLATTLVLSLTGEATNNNEIVQEWMTVDVIRAS